MKHLSGYLSLSKGSVNVHGDGYDNNSSKVFPKI